MASMSTGRALLSFLRRREKHHARKNTHAAAAPHMMEPHTVVCDVEGALLRSPSTFPYFMLVAMEAGGFLRAFLLLLLYPLVCCVAEDVGVKLMAFVSFCGLRKDGFRAGRAVLPKHLLGGVGVEGFEVVMGEEGRRRKVVGVSSMPKVMVEGFLREWLGLDVVVGAELKVVGGYYTGFMEEEVHVAELEEESEGGALVVAIGRSGKCERHPIFSKCKDIYVVDEDVKRSWRALPREKHHKPLVFHDGRLAFLPTPAFALSMFLWLPFGFVLAIARALLFLTLPYKVSSPLLAFTGIKTRFTTATATSSSSTTTTTSSPPKLYVCNHRTLLDPLFISWVLGTSVTAATYSVSHVTEILSPIKTARLTRDRDEDRRRMGALLKEGDLVVCPEGTTCREPFLLRFSPLFAELSDEVVPVALRTEVSMFHGTTAAGRKGLDSLFFLMNPFPSYDIIFLEKVSVGKCNSSYEIANLVQGVIGEALGYECTSLTRKDKYMLLAGNEGIAGESSRQ